MLNNIYNKVSGFLVTIYECLELSAEHLIDQIGQPEEHEQSETTTQSNHYQATPIMIHDETIWQSLTVPRGTWINPDPRYRAGMQEETERFRRMMQWHQDRILLERRHHQQVRENLLRNFGRHILSNHMIPRRGIPLTSQQKRIIRARVRQWSENQIRNDEDDNTEDDTARVPTNDGPDYMNYSDSNLEHISRETNGPHVYQTSNTN